ncbi:MAG: hypothetical protein WD356_09775 [Pseudomonadales bacterium]
MLTSICFIMGLIVTHSVMAGPAPGPGGPPGGGGEEHVDLDPLNDFVFATWGSGDGNQAASQVGCAASANTNRPSPQPGDETLPYDFKVTNASGGAGFYIYLDGNNANSGNSRLAIQFRHRDLMAGSGAEYLTHDVFDTHDHDGQFKNCMDGDNSQLEVSINEAELAAVRAGNYTGSFSAEIRGGVNGTTTSAEDFQVSIDVTDMVRISSMDNIDLGSWEGTGSINATETFCVYSNNDSASYNISISSPNQDGSANFYLVNSDTSAQVFYLLSFNDNVGGGAGSMVSDVAISGTGANNSIDCDGGDNAKLTVDIAETNLTNVPADAYGDTLTLVVSPE